MHKPYPEYQLEDFLADQEFKTWVLNGRNNPVQTAFWKKIADRYPSKAPLMEEAASLICHLGRLSPGSSETGRIRIWERIEEELNSEWALPPVNPKTLWYRRPAIAASLVLLLLAGAALFFSRPSPDRIYTTGNGESKKIILPDSSVVMLAANSNLRRKNDWKNDVPREVWIRGEAYFEVRHLNRDTSRVLPSQRFVVHTGQAVRVEVLGTTFFVRDRREQASVTLETGEVRVSCNNRSRLLRPGQAVRLEPGTNELLLQAPPAVGWDAHAGELVLNNATVREIADAVEDYFGKTVVLPDTRLHARRFDGFVPFDTEQHAVASLEALLDVKAVSEHDRIFLQ